ncbi:hypothetical protein CERSUDRAFT_71510 [Gelatoporia subvermispora B]|uniref:Uncharacterized protein n=1 Tax=Ceriporiopsis subvermispora (strain B) TaxID=914234 RepID=M2QRB1_CERS8|nr:hypothetical protein CERSUDRAFT_71510 [Gelatoporia subvermispora B]
MTDILCLAPTLAMILPFSHTPLGDPRDTVVVIWAIVFGVVLILLFIGLFLFFRCHPGLFGPRPNVADAEAAPGQLPEILLHDRFNAANANRAGRDGVLAGIPPVRGADAGDIDSIDANLPDIPAPAYSSADASMFTGCGQPSNTLFPPPYGRDADRSGSPASIPSGQSVDVYSDRERLLGVPGEVTREDAESSTANSGEQVQQ